MLTNDIGRNAQPELEKDTAKGSNHDLDRKVVVSKILRSIRELSLYISLWRIALEENRDDLEKKSILLENVLTELQQEQEKKIGLFLDIVEKLEQEVVVEIQYASNEFLSLGREEFSSYLTNQLKEHVPNNAIQLMNEFAENRCLQLFNSLHQEYQLHLRQEFVSIAQDFYDFSETIVERMLAVTAQIFDLEHAPSQIEFYHSVNQQNFTLHFTDYPKLFPSRGNLIVPVMKGIPIIAILFHKIAVSRFEDLFHQIPRRLCFALTGELNYHVGSVAGDLRLMVKMVVLSLRSILERVLLDNIQGHSCRESFRAAEEDLFQLRVWQDILLHPTEEYPA